MPGTCVSHACDCDASCGHRGMFSGAATSTASVISIVAEAAKATRLASSVCASAKCVLSSLYESAAICNAVRYLAASRSSWAMICTYSARTVMLTIRWALLNFPHELIQPSASFHVARSCGMNFSRNRSRAPSSIAVFCNETAGGETPDRRAATARRWSCHDWLGSGASEIECVLVTIFAEECCSAGSRCGDCRRCCCCTASCLLSTLDPEPRRSGSYDTMVNVFS